MVSISSLSPYACYSAENNTLFYPHASPHLQSSYCSVFAIACKTRTPPPPPPEPEFSKINDYPKTKKEFLFIPFRTSGPVIDKVILA